MSMIDDATEAGREAGHAAATWVEIDASSDSFILQAEDAYVDCALWTEESSIDEQAEEMGLDVIGLHNDADAYLRADIRDFLADEETAQLIEQSGLDAGQVGHDFWLTRNRHGAGFWDRGLGTIGDALTKISHPYGERYLYLGDDGWIYVQ